MRHKYSATTKVFFFNRENLLKIGENINEIHNIWVWRYKSVYNIR